MKIRALLFVLFLAIGFQATAKKINLDRVEPPFWWTGMEVPELQLLVHGENISSTRPHIDYPGVVMESVAMVKNPNYLFIDLIISNDAVPGKFDIEFKEGTKTVETYTYELLAREPGSAQRKGFDESDIIYLVFPDRFVNGDPSNDSHPQMLEKSDPTNPDSRFGGDLQGVMDKLDYMEDLGVTALWLNPILENNQEAYSYHGYAISDFYRVDPRMGSNADYKKLNNMLHERGMKAVMDMVFNHCGSGHWWMDDLPTEDWINQWPEYTRSNFRGSVVFDPYASGYDTEQFHKGWFDINMPDLNQRNEFLMNYLTQNSIWWIEYSGLDGIRMDTYPYPFKEPMARWAKRITTEYPNFSIVGEAWLSTASQVAPWEATPGVETGYSSHLPYVFDFPMYDAFGQAFNEDGTGWSSGMMKLYDVLTQDFLYGEEVSVVVFPDNHDGDRLFSKVKENLGSQKLAITFLLTTRGVPQIYYGTEILMTGAGQHGKMRKMFPGGSPDHESDKFTESGRTEAEQDMFEHLTTLTKWRNNNKVIHTGKLKHFIPENNMYVYFRYNDNDLVMVVLNNKNEDQQLQASRFAEVIDGISSGKNILDGETYNLNNLTIPAKSSMVLELK